MFYSKPVAVVRFDSSVHEIFPTPSDEHNSFLYVLETLGSGIVSTSGAGQSLVVLSGCDLPSGTEAAERSGAGY